MSVPTLRTLLGIAAIGAQKAVPLLPAAHKFALQVSIPSGAITSWTVALEGSLDGVNWTTIATHNAVIGSTVWAVDKPVSFVRVNVTALTLGTAPSIAVGLIAYP